MDLALEPDQELLRDTARKLLAERFPIEDLAAAEDGWHDDAAWREMADLGWIGLGVPEERGGSGGSLVDMAVLAAELGRVLCPAPLLAVAAAAAALESCASPDADALLKKLAAGEARPVLAVADASGRWAADVVGVRIDGSHASGTAEFVEGAGAADSFLVPAVGPTGLTLVLVDAAAGVDVELRRSMAGLHWGALHLRKAPQTALDAGFSAVSAAMGRVGVLQAAWAGGAAARLLADTVAYARDRVQFGVPIGSFQAVQHRLADCDIAVAEAVTLGYKAASMLDAGHPAARRLASTAFVRSTANFVRVARSCHQVWGGMGFSAEAHVHHFSRRAKVAQQQWGGTSSHLDVIAEELRSTPLVVEQYRARLEGTTG